MTWTLDDLLDKLESVSKNGNGWKAKCPFHADKVASMSVTIGDKGGIIAHCHAGCDNVFAQLREMMGGGSPALVTNKKTRNLTVQVTPAPEDYMRVHKYLKTPSQIWEYRGLDGQLNFVTCRFETEKGKEFRPQTYRHNPSTGDTAWSWTGPDSPSTLYRLNHLDKTRTTIVVEGEKAADALALIMPDVNVVCWWGGANNASKADWTPLAGMQVELWPDADEPGVKVMNDIAGILAKLGCSVLVYSDIINALARHGVTQKGFDAADAMVLGWDIDKIAEVLADAADDQTHTVTVEYTNEPVATPTPTETAPTTPDNGDEYANMPFIPLGYDKGTYYYMSRATKQVHELSETSHKKSNLLSIVSDRSFWERYCPSMSKKPGADWDGCEERMKSACHRFGIFDESLIRGRGAWFDKGKVVLHLGDKLVVDGQVMEIGSRPGEFIYELSRRLNVGGADPLHSDDAQLVSNIADMFSFEQDIYSRLLSGWCVLAPVCGILDWRPHIWITGGSGSGKSTIEKDFIRPLLSNMAMVVQGGSTEAGIRQTLKHDARPVIIDEAESENEKNRNQMQSILELMRQASTESDSEIFKGTTGGKAQTFKVRSMFVLASIGVAVKQQADENRISILSLVRRNDAEHYRAIQAELAKLTPEYASRLISRTIKLIPVIRKNAEKFAVEISKYTGSRRMGDQYGTLMAGYMSLFYDGEIDERVITAESKRFEKAITAITRTDNEDEWQCLNHILQSIVKVDRHANSSVMVSVVELIEGIHDNRNVAGIVPDEARSALRRYGIAYDGGDDDVKFGNGHTQITHLLRNTPWVNTWTRFLLRLPHAHKSGDNKVSFAGVRIRVIAVPVNIIIGKEVE